MASSFILLSEVLVALSRRADVAHDRHAARVVIAEVSHQTAAATNDGKLHEARVVFVPTQRVEDSSNVLARCLHDAVKICRVDVRRAVAQDGFDVAVIQLRQRP